MIDEHRLACAEQYMSYRQPVSHEASPHVRTQPYTGFVVGATLDVRIVDCEACKLYR
jgi:hypothetical protein